MSQVTASKTSLLLNCTRPFDPSVERTHEEPTDDMKYGSAFHEVLELNATPADCKAIAAKWGVSDAVALYKHAVLTLACLKKWLDGDNYWKEKFRVVSRETHRATRIPPRGIGGGYLGVITRVCDFDKETHTYDLRKGEFGGTDDLVVESSITDYERHTMRLRRVVIDYKSGDWGTYHTPKDLPQMMTLALQTNADAVAILHSPREGIPVMHVDDVSAAELSAFAKRLKKQMARIGDGTLRPGEHCKRCPAKVGCPARDADLLQKANAIIKVAVSSEEMAQPLDKGRFHVFLQELGRLEKRAREVLKADVKAGEVIVRPDGQVLVIRTAEYETLSKASVIRALGKSKGEKVIADLRKKGCVPTETRESLWAVKE